MRGTYGVAAHILEDADLAADTGLVGDTAQRAQVVVIAHPFELQRFAVKEEAFALAHLDGADTEGGGIFVFQFVALIDLRNRGVEVGCLGTPHGRIFNDKLLLEGVVVEVVAAHALGHQGLAAGVDNRGLDHIVAHRFPLRHLPRSFLLDLGIAVVQVGGDDLRTPHRHMSLVGHQQMHVAVEAGSGIPARALGEVLEPYGQRVALARTQVGRGVEKEGVVSVGPVASLLSVDVDPGVAHGAVEYQRILFALDRLGHVERTAVPAGTHEGQTARAAGMLHGLFLAVLDDSRVLLVVIDTEGSVDGPVVGNADRLPLRVVELRILELRVVFAGEFPPLLQQRLGAYLCLCRKPQRQGQQHQ